MTLTMIQLVPRMERLMRWAHGERLLTVRDADDLGYALHAALAAAFGADHAPRPFALVQPPGGGRPPQLLGYSPHPGDSLRDRALAVAEPAVAAAVGLDAFAAKSMPEAWRPGARFGFAVRVRPMLRTDRDGDRARTKEVDAFVLSPPGSSRGAVYAAWLRARMEAGGAVIERASLDAFRRTRVLRRAAPAGASTRPLRPQEGPDATLSGVLRVVDGERFAALLARGIGRHRAFGFGMLLLRPA